MCKVGVNLPWEITDQYIRSGHRSPEEFQPNSLRTIILSEDGGVKAVIGKPKGKDTMEIHLPWRRETSFQSREEVEKVVSVNRKLVVAGSSGFVLGSIMWFIGSVATTVMSNLPALAPYVAFIIGFGGAIAATLSEDVKQQ